MGYSLGLDLGTTFVAAAIARAGQVGMFTLGDNSVMIPAAVCAREDGVVVTGDAASRCSVSNPDRVCREFKRGLGDPTPLMLGGGQYSAAELLGLLLKDVLRKIVEAEGGPPERVALTHPASWGTLRRELFEKAPALAGLRNWLMVAQPEVAASYYAATRQLRNGEVVAVYDLGGGAFDAAVVRKHAGGVEILGTPEGIEDLGGIDFDEAILTHVNYVSDDALTKLDMRDPQTAVALARLRQDCIVAKEALSVDTETTLPVFLPGRHFDVRLTRSDFEDMVRAQIESTIGALSRTLRSAQISPLDLRAVLLFGGSSQIPLIAQMISAELGCPTLADAHPKHAGALGAATLAAVPVFDHAGIGNGFRRELNEVSSPMPSRIADDAASLPSFMAPSITLGRLQTAPKRTTLRLPNRHDTVATGEKTPKKLGRRWSPPQPLITSILMLAVVGLIAVVTTVGIRQFSSMARTQSLASGSAFDSPASTSAVAASVPIPSLGPTIAVGATPGFVVASPNSRLLYIANQDAKVITVVDTSVNKVTATIPVDAGPPRYMAFSPDGHRVYVSIFTDQKTINAVGVLDTTSNEIVATIPVGTRPFALAVSPDGKRVLVPSHDIGMVSVIDTEKNSVIGQIKVAANPHWVAFSHDGSHAYTANHMSNLISVIDTATNSLVATVPVGTSPHSVAANPTRPLVANVNYDSASVSMIDTNSNTVIATLPVGRNPQNISWAPDGRFAYVANGADNTISVISADHFRVTATIPVGRNPTSIAVLPNGKLAYVSNADDGTLTVLNLAG